MPMGPKPSCRENGSLIERVTEARKLYINAARGLQDLAPADFDEAYQRAERARVFYESARDALKHYSKEHGCAAPESEC